MSRGLGERWYDNNEFTNVWADLDSGNNLAMRRIFTDEVDGLVARIDSSGTAASYLKDRRGSVREMTDHSGTLQNVIAYDGFGGVTSESSSSFGDRYKWAGGEYHSEIALYLIGIRDYNPETGRWERPDPIVFAAGDPNLYRYVRNNTTNKTDPSGLAEITEKIKMLGSQDISTQLHERRRELEANKSTFTSKEVLILVDLWQMPLSTRAKNQLRIYLTRLSGINAAEQTLQELTKSKQAPAHPMVPEDVRKLFTPLIRQLGDDKYAVRESAQKMLIAILNPEVYKKDKQIQAQIRKLTKAPAARNRLGVLLIEEAVRLNTWGVGKEGEIDPEVWLRASQILVDAKVDVLATFVINRNLIRFIGDTSSTAQAKKLLTPIAKGRFARETVSEAQHQLDLLQLRP